MNRLFPVFLQLQGRPCLVVGGGAVAYRRMKALLDSQATVTVVCPNVGSKIAKLVREGKVQHVARQYRQQDLAGMFIVVAATNDVDLNQQIYLQAEARNILINVVDKPEVSNFYMPSIVQRGHLKIAISTNGLAPALAQALGKKIEQLFPERISQEIEELGKKRQFRIRNGTHTLVARRRLAKEEAKKVIDSFWTFFQSQ